MRRFMLVLLATASSGLLFVRCGGGTTTQADTGRAVDTLDVAATRTIIEAKTSQFTQAHITGDTAFLNNIFTDDARVLAPNADPISGRRAIAAINLEYVNYGIKEFRETTTALYGSSDYVIDEGTYVMRCGKENTTESGKYINVWKNVDGDWKIYANIWNTNAPAKP